MQPEVQNKAQETAWWAGRQFQVISSIKQNSTTQLKFFDQLIVIGGQSSIKKIDLKLSDLIGVKTKITQEKYVQFKIMGFPLRKKYFSSLKRHVQVSATFYLKNESEESAKNAKQLQEILKQSISNNVDRSPLKIIIYFNPIAGSNSKNKLNVLVDFLAHTNLQYDLITTKHKGHCGDHIKTIDTKQYRAVAIVSGDGLVHQFLNSRVQIPMTHVPAGSGNGFAKSQTYIAGQNCGVQESIYLVIKNRKKGFNITKHQLQKFETPIYSFLAFQWCILADLDMNSEFLRILGGLRFDIYGAWRLVSMKRYPGKLYFSETQTELPSLQQDLSLNPKFEKVDDSFLYLAMCTVPFLSDKYKFAPKLKLDDQKIDMEYILESDGRTQLTKFLLSSSSGDHFDKNEDKPAKGMNFKYRNIKSWRLEPAQEGQRGVFGIDGQKYDAQKIQSSICDTKMVAFI